jgi:putative membrane protein
MAMDRTYWAAERTLMGWIRTAISMISFGFTIGKVGQALGEVEVRGLRGMRMIGVDSIAYLLVILGTVALLAAAVQHSRRVHELCEQGLRRQPSIAFAVALVLSVLGIVAFSSLVLKI